MKPFSIPRGRPILALFILILAVATGQFHLSAQDAAVERIRNVVYGRAGATELTMDVFAPAKPNGHGVLLLMSGGWASNAGLIELNLQQPFLEHGYTVFTIVHGSQPKFTIEEIIGQIHRAVRFVRHNAAEYRVSPDELAITGVSSGGHLSLMIATTGGPGKADGTDPVDRESSAVREVACFFSPTDFLNWRSAGDNQVGIGPAGSRFKAAFGARSSTPEGRDELGHEISPIYHVSSATPPVLIIHGDADDVVPLFQSREFERKCREAGVPVKLLAQDVGVASVAVYPMRLAAEVAMELASWR